MACIHSINVPDHVENSQAYVKSAQNRIKANATKGRHKRWLASSPTAQMVNDFLTYSGEFETKREWIEAEGAWKFIAVHPVVAAAQGDFFEKMQNALADWGSLSPGQEAAVVKMIERARERVAKRAEQRAAEAASAQWVGEEGERRDFTLTLRAYTAIETDFGMLRIYVMTDEAGNVLVYKGSSLLKNADGHNKVNKGDRIEMKATIKAHGVRDGVKQTVLTRPAQK